jgi:hypothetical protein
VTWRQEDQGGGPVVCFVEDAGVEGGGGSEAGEVLAEVGVSLLCGKVAEHLVLKFRVLVKT